MKKYPLKLSYITKTALWAGTKLKDFFDKESEFNTVSESWELTVRKNEMATVLNGEAEGLTLKEYFEACGYDCVCKGFGASDRFPLLVKLIETFIEFVRTCKCEDVNDYEHCGEYTVQNASMFQTLLSIIANPSIDRIVALSGFIQGHSVFRIVGKVKHVKISSK